MATTKEQSGEYGGKTVFIHKTCANTCGIYCVGSCGLLKLSTSYRMKNQIIFSFLLLPFLSNCSLIGAEIGKEVDETVGSDASNNHKYETQYMVEGLQEDVEIIKAFLLSPAKEPPYVVPEPCKEKNSIQVSSIKKGCWCEKNNR